MNLARFLVCYCLTVQYTSICAVHVDLRKILQAKFYSILVTNINLGKLGYVCNLLKQMWRLSTMPGIRYKLVLLLMYKICLDLGRENLLEALCELSIVLRVSISVVSEPMERNAVILHYF